MSLVVLKSNFGQCLNNANKVFYFETTKSIFFGIKICHGLVRWLCHFLAAECRADRHVHECACRFPYRAVCFLIIECHRAFAHGLCKPVKLPSLYHADAPCLPGRLAKLPRILHHSHTKIIFLFHFKGVYWFDF